MNSSRLDYRNGLSLPQPVKDAIRTVRREFIGCTEGEIEQVAMSIAESALQYEFGVTADRIADRIAEELHNKRRQEDDKARSKLSVSMSMSQSQSDNVNCKADIIPLQVKRTV